MEWLAESSDSGVFAYGEPWDARMIRGCRCDSGFEGPSCSEMICPTGDDPLTTGQVNEVHRVTCEATSGTAALSFRGEWTREIAYDADVCLLYTSDAADE